MSNCNTKFVAYTGFLHLAHNMFVQLPLHDRFMLHFRRFLLDVSVEESWSSSSFEFSVSGVDLAANSSHSCSIKFLRLILRPETSL